MMDAILQAIVSCACIFARGYQQQNVIGGHYKLAIIFAYVLAVLDVALVTFVVARGWASILPVGTGAAVGISLSMYLHRKLHRGKSP